jgi:hypothetical protein
MMRLPLLRNFSGLTHRTEAVVVVAEAVIIRLDKT